MDASDWRKADFDASEHPRLDKADEPPRLAELVRQIRPENRYQEIPSGPETGKEAVEWQGDGN